MSLLASSTAGPFRPGGFVSISRDWESETAFLVCGGPSFSLVDVERLRGRRVMVVNSSLYAVPFADILFYGDERWEMANRAAVKAFAGRVLSSTYGSQQCNYVEFLSRPRPGYCPGGLSTDPSEALMRHTSARGAINVLCHLGVSKIITLGLDGGPDASGNAHHHAKHPWGMNKDVWHMQRAELETIVGPLLGRGVTLLNASLGSKIPFWPIVNPEDALAA